MVRHGMTRTMLIRGIATEVCPDANINRPSNSKFARMVRPALGLRLWYVMSWAD